MKKERDDATKKVRMRFILQLHFQQMFLSPTDS